VTDSAGGIVGAVDLADETVEIAPRLDRPVPAACVATNVAAMSGDFGRHMLKDVYPARIAQQSAVTLARLPARSVLVGDGSFGIVVGDHAVAEQALPGSVYLPAFASRDTIDVADEAVIVARYGVSTWGHWLDELLPRVVVAEHAFPGRFAFVVPRAVLAEPSDLWPRILESLHFVGVDRSRLLPVDPETDYRFNRLHAVTGVWTDHLPHPHITDQFVRLTRRRRPRARKVLLTRSSSALRHLVNSNEVEREFVRRGYLPVAIGSLPFADQVAVFSESSSVASVLGSTLAGLIFSPVGVRVTSLAPARFGDRFFYALTLARWGTFVDVRGRTEDEGSRSQLEGNRPFRIEIDDLRKLLDGAGDR